eukprot:CAMPEP_0118650570 /NCGR_PEP_ID=MMETSP0785-20121206/10316_1 /TAXON_ID=91992 /ORGANISM="Bolidomonas pacifica, Strain CCMP 1866" /LENGTH=110 /DNA_ID=CAMNT_0006542951 /DNA_START=149 /DNA_END=481 /DNA_ORIENTATION=+
MLGDSYVQSEFRQHKNANQTQASNFLDSWVGYADDMENERNRRLVDLRMDGVDKGRGKGWGKDMDMGSIEDMSEGQREQMKKLKEETRKNDSDDVAMDGNGIGEVRIDKG